MRGDLSCETFLNIRWENYAIEGANEALDWLERVPGNVISVNDHATAYVGLDGDDPKILKMANRLGIPVKEAAELIETVLTRRDEVPAMVDYVCKRAAGNGKKIFAHDETSKSERSSNRALGMSVSEFPMTHDAAQEAINHDEEVIMGAPNVVRGGSQNGALCAATAIRENLCTVLASDYYYPAQFNAVFKLVDDNILDFADAWKLISSSPAKAVGLSDRGKIETGLRADCILVDMNTRKIRAVLAKGNKVFVAAA